MRVTIEIDWLDDGRDDWDDNGVIVCSGQNMVELDQIMVLKLLLSVSKLCLCVYANAS